MKAPLATPRARALAAALRDARVSRGVGQRELAHRLGLTHPRLSHWESGRRLPTPEEVAGILGCLRVIGEERDELLELARNAHEPNWLEAPHSLPAVVECERTASSIFVWNPTLLPGPLQIAEYTRPILETPPTPEIEQQLMIRLGRQEVLTRRNPSPYTAILGEAALRQGIGGAGGMIAQLRHLLVMARKNHVTLRVLPSGIGWHPGLVGPFTVFDFEDLPSIVSVEHHRGSAYLYDEGYVAGYKAAAKIVLNLAMSEQESLALIAEVITELEATQ
ncbi:MAG TPA: helix-turn-helix transcriptional regulator [Amycolatopsis sp.]|nr:helix-turn-helix transcriptional regulator [Amycolatopsis sp.]